MRGLTLRDRIWWTTFYLGYRFPRARRAARWAAVVLVCIPPAAVIALMAWLMWIGASSGA